MIVVIWLLFVVGACCVLCVGGCLLFAVICVCSLFSELSPLCGCC